MNLLQFIVDQTAECTSRNDIEAGWNSFVHGLVLSIASKWSIHSNHVKVHNVTTAGLKRALRPTIDSKLHYGRKVDFVYTLQKRSIPALGRSNVIRALRSLVRGEKGVMIGDCNAFEFKNTAYEPAAISIETKRLDCSQAEGEGGLAQCAVCLDAQIRWLHMVRNLAAEESEFASDLSSIPALPSVVVLGTEWFVQLAKDLPKDPPKVSESCTYFFGGRKGIRVGDTETVTGVLQVLDALFVLIDYSATIYMPWLSKLLDALPDGARSQGQMLAKQLQLLGLQGPSEDARSCRTKLKR
jgi:hypothetical protein